MDLKCVIIDDEPLAASVIESYLSKLKGFKVVKIFNSAVGSIPYLNKNKVDILFLDINMPVLNGIVFLKQLSVTPKVIMTTAYKEFAAESFDLNVIDYLVKPIPFPRFLKAINKVISSLKISQNTLNQKPYLFVKINRTKIQKIYLEEILVIENLNDYINILTETGNYITHQTLNNFTNQLPSENFIRINRKYTIANSKVDSVEGNCVKINGLKYPIEKKYLENNVKNKILNLGIQNTNHLLENKS